MQERVELAINYAAAQKQFRKNLSEGYVAPVQGMKDQIQIIQDYVKKKYNPYKIYKNMFEYIKESKYFSSAELQKIKKYNKSI
jgi:hypothetical protein